MAILSGIKKGFNSTISFFAGAWSELKKVRWPTRKELVSYTIVVLVTVVFVTLYFFVIDLGLSELVELFF